MLTNNFLWINDIKYWTEHLVLEKIQECENDAIELLNSTNWVYIKYKLKCISNNVHNIYVDISDLLNSKCIDIKLISDQKVSYVKAPERQIFEKWKLVNKDSNNANNIKFYKNSVNLYKTASKYRHLIEQKDDEKVKENYKSDLAILLSLLNDILLFVSRKYLGYEENIPNFHISLYKNQNNNSKYVKTENSKEFVRLNTELSEQTNLHDNLKTAYERLCCSKGNIFLSGDAGTGKTSLIKYYLNNYCKDNNIKCLICATTARAAKLLNGKTLHQGFKISPNIDEVINNIKTLSLSDCWNIKYWAFDGYRGYTHLITDIDTIIIDEISMCRIDVFDYLSKIIELINGYRESQGKRKIKLIVIGDFFQLPPVCPDEDEKILAEPNIYGLDKYGETKLFAFESKYWEKFGFNSPENCIYLIQPIRQQHDLDYYNNLNILKWQSLDRIDSCLKYFNSKIIPTEEANSMPYIRLYARNSSVQAFNEQMLDTNLSTGEIFNFPAFLDEKLEYLISKSQIDYETIESKINVSLSLNLRKGATIMFVKNDSDFRNRKYINGEFGEIVDISKECLKVKKVNTDQEFILLREEFELYDDPKYDSKSDKVIRQRIGTLTQFPIKLAYAITVHKSQGTTFDNIIYDPMPNGNREVEKGLIYVALSRVKNISGLNLLNPIKEEYLRKSRKVSDYYKMIGVSAKKE